MTMQGPQQQVAMHKASDIAPSLLKKRVWINWPYLQEAEIVSVADADVRVNCSASTSS